MQLKKQTEVLCEVEPSNWFYYSYLGLPIFVNVTALWFHLWCCKKRNKPCKPYCFYVLYYILLSLVVSVIINTHFISSIRSPNRYGALWLAIRNLRSWDLVHQILDLLEWYCNRTALHRWFAVQRERSLMRLARECRRLSETS